MSRYMDADALKKRMLDYFSPPEAFDVADLRPSWAIQDGIEDIFATFPTADVAPVVHGEWSDDGLRSEAGNAKLYSCSNCSYRYVGFGKEFLYCPSCGARMDL